MRGPLPGKPRLAVPAGLAVPQPAAFKPPKGTRAVLSNGMVVHMLRDATFPVAHLTAFIRAGKIHDPAGKIGLGDMAAGLLRDGGAGGLAPERMDEKLEFLGASVESSVGIEESRLTLTSLSKDLDEVLDIYAAILTAPAFDPEKTAIRREELLELIRRRDDDTARQAVREALRAFYGPGHPYGWRPEEATVQAVTGDDMRAWHADFCRPGNVILAVAGDFGTEEQLLARLEARFSGWKGGAAALPGIPPVGLPRGRRVFLLRKDIPQASVVLVLGALKRHDPREFALMVANEMLGGGLSSRLTSEIRSRHGLAYSVYSYPVKKPDHGYLLAYCGTKPESAGRAAAEMLRQFDLMGQEEPPAEEVKRAKDAIANSFIFRFPTPFDLISERAAFEYYGYRESALDDYVDRINATGQADVQGVSREVLSTGDALLLFVGDPDKFDARPDEFGPVTELKEE
ncbi:MAG: pitrilysin family protein [Elusimicrobia bacterium]|nr:pitrilysin family protein [Elusimicrobiota bacterium]